jgi:hypothetical protein
MPSGVRRLSSVYSKLIAINPWAEESAPFGSGK